MTPRKAVAALLLPVLLAGCATAGPVLGRPVEVRQTSGSTKDGVRGELVAVGPDRMWVAGPGSVQAIPRGAVREVRVRRHGLTRAKALGWVFLGALASTIALGAACASVEGGECGRIAVATGLTWGVIGVPSAIALGDSSELHVEPSKWDSLRGYARFPQGLPEGVDTDSLVPRKDPGAER